jgi:carboxyl-terminal processing protease
MLAAAVATAGAQSPFAAGASNHMSQISDVLNKYANVLYLIDRYYIDSVNVEQIVERAVVSAIRSLDPHSYYVSKEEYKALNEPLAGNFEGVGIEFNIVDDTLIVVTPVPGGPSEKSGLHSGDRIIGVDGENIAGTGLTIEKVYSLLRGPKGTQVILEVKRDAAIHEFIVTRDKIPLNSVDAAYEVKPGTGYIKLSRFSATSMKEITEAYLKIHRPQSLILDLRSNGGGYMDAAIRLADQFFDAGKLLVYTEGLNSPVQKAVSSDGGLFVNCKVTVLINEGSASASEIVAGAIQDWDRGTIIGRRSFGKGLVQKEYMLGNDGSAMRMTVSRYFTPSGRAIQSPYEKGESDKYYNDFYSRVSSEAYDVSKIKLSDSLKYSTLVKKRAVYGGGGIMPDIYVPADTSEYSRYSDELFRKGVLPRFVSAYADRSKAELSEHYETFEEFNADFFVTDELFGRMIDFGEKNGVMCDESGIAVSGDYLKRYIKARLAGYLFDSSCYFKVINETDKVFLKAIEGSYEL